jgi:hypothetical protein
MRVRRGAAEGAVTAYPITNEITPKAAPGRGPAHSGTGGSGPKSRALVISYGRTDRTACRSGWSFGRSCRAGLLPRAAGWRAAHLCAAADERQDRRGRVSSLTSIPVQEVAQEKRARHRAQLLPVASSSEARCLPLQLSRAPCSADNPHLEPMTAPGRVGQRGLLYPRTASSYSGRRSPPLAATQSSRDDPLVLSSLSGSAAGNPLHTAAGAAAHLPDLSLRA